MGVGAVGFFLSLHFENFFLMNLKTQSTTKSAVSKQIVDTCGGFFLNFVLIGLGGKRGPKTFEYLTLV